MDIYKFKVFMGDDDFKVEIKSAVNEGDAWYLIEKQFEDATKIELMEVV